MIPAFNEHRLLIVTGKGGVGKTTIAAAIALESARQGKRTLVCEVNAQERIAPLLGKPLSGPEITSVEENLWSVNVQPQQALKEYALMILKFERIYNAVFENRLVRHFLRFVPSIQEIVVLGKILFHLREKRKDGSWRFERIVIDAPATGHALTFFSVPQVVLDTVPPGALADDSRWMRDILIDQATTAAILVSLPEDMPVNETLDLHKALSERVKLKPQAVVLNGFISKRFDEATLAQLQSTPGLHEAARVHEARADLSLESEKRLGTLGLPIIRVERHYKQLFDRKALEQVASALGAAT